MILIGDHQPPALVSGEGASWDVPVHIISNRTEILDRLIAQGFHSGLDPGSAPLGKMHELLPILLDAFGDREAIYLHAATRGSTPPPGTSGSTAGASGLKPAAAAR